MLNMKRRDFITLLGGAVAWPLAARAQQTGKLPTIGYLGATTPVAESQRVAAFVQRSANLVGSKVATWRSSIAGRRAAPSAPRTSRPNSFSSKSRFIVTYGTPAVLAVKQATSVTPIVFAVAGEPVGTGLVASLARSGGNVTGLSIQKTDLAGKRLELLREIVPGLHRLAILANVGSPAVVPELREVEAGASTLGLDVVTSEIRRADDIAPAFEALKGRAEALYVCGDSLVDTNRIRIITLALAARLPTVSDFREYVEVGGLISYGPNFPDLFRRAADLVDKILRGAKPADLPVEQPTKFLHPLQKPLFRTIQVRPKDSPTARRQAEDAVSCHQQRWRGSMLKQGAPHLKRRDFITLLGGAAAAWPLAARAQQRGGMRRIGVLMGTAAADVEGQVRIAAFLQRLAPISTL